MKNMLPQASRPQEGETTATMTVQLENKENKEKEKAEDKLEDKVEQLKKTLAAKGVADTEILEQLTALETLSKEPAQPALTHKTLNQLQRAEKQFAASVNHLRELDERWKKWSQCIQKKVTEQGALYMEQRKVLSAKTKELRERLRGLRSELRHAAQQQGTIKEEALDLTEDIPIPFDVNFDITINSSDDEEKNNTTRTQSRSRSRTPVASPAKVPKTS